jgi:serine/threonine-protein kinase PpkA
LRVSAEHCYIAMEYFDEGHLGSKLVRPMDSLEALGLAENIAQALSIIHAAGIVHRDLKPANIMLRSAGSVALIDFGISLGGQETAASLEISGTPYYMSPEQARGEATDERTDLYALGVILYQMLTGERPYVGNSTTGILDRHCHAPLPRLPWAHRALQPLIERLLAKDARERPGSAREVAEALERARALASDGSDADEPVRASGG